MRMQFDMELYFDGKKDSDFEQLVIGHNLEDNHTVKVFIEHNNTEKTEWTRRILLLKLDDENTADLGAEQLLINQRYAFEQEARETLDELFLEFENFDKDKYFTAAKILHNYIAAHYLDWLFHIKTEPEAVTLARMEADIEADKARKH